MSEGKSNSSIAWMFEAALKAKIAAKQVEIEELTPGRDKRPKSTATFNNHDLPQLPFKVSRERTPLEDLLAASSLDSTSWSPRTDTSAS